MKTSLRSLALLGLLAPVALTGCQTLTAETSATLNTAWVGQPFAQFVLEHGGPISTFPTSDGGAVYSWSTSQTVGGIETQCAAQIATNGQGIITTISISHDTIGVWRTSRCVEIFGEG